MPSETLALATAKGLPQRARCGLRPRTAISAAAAGRRRCPPGVNRGGRRAHRPLDDRAHAARRDRGRRAGGPTCHGRGGPGAAGGVGRRLGRRRPAPALATCRALLTEGATATDSTRPLDRGSDARPFDLARVRLLYGEHLRRERRRGDARPHLREAFESFDRLGADPWADRARTELRATGETARSAVRAPQDRLTPQELQIARLVADGLRTKTWPPSSFSPRARSTPTCATVLEARDPSRTQLARVPLGDGDHGGFADASDGAPP